MKERLTAELKKKTEEVGKDLVNPVPLQERVGGHKNDKKKALEKINKLKDLQKNIGENKDLFDSNHGSGE